MLIIGWMAMWRPLEIFLYQWVPIRRRCRILAKLAEMPVIVQSKRIGCHVGALLLRRPQAFF